MHIAISRNNGRVPEAGQVLGYFCRISPQATFTVPEATPLAPTEFTTSPLGRLIKETNRGSALFRSVTTGLDMAALGTSCDNFPDPTRWLEWKVYR
jgi:hypothetical protein